MELCFSPEDRRILTESVGSVDAWSPEKCRVMARVARDFKALMRTDGQRTALEGVALQLERQAVAGT